MELVSLNEISNDAKPPDVEIGLKHFFNQEVDKNIMRLELPALDQQTQVPSIKIDYENSPFELIDIIEDQKQFEEQLKNRLKLTDLEYSNVKVELKKKIVTQQLYRPSYLLILFFFMWVCPIQHNIQT